MLDYIISSLEQMPENTGYLEHEMYDEPVVYTLDSARKRKEELLRR